MFSEASSRVPDICLILQLDVCWCCIFDRVYKQALGRRQRDGHLSIDAFSAIYGEGASNLGAADVSLVLLQFVSLVDFHTVC